MKKIMIDLDEVIADGGFLAIINEFLNTNYTNEDFDGMLMQDILPDKKAFFEFFLTRNMYDKAYLLPNAYDVIKLLNEKYEVYICSAFIIPDIPKESGITILHKYNFLLDSLDFLSPKQFIFSDNKEIINCDVKIDDRLYNLKTAETLLLFDTRHNKNYSDEELKDLGIKRVKDWIDIKNILLSE